MSEPWRGAFGDLTREHGFEPLRIEGSVPPGLRGTLYRCGPARTECFGHRYRHDFDGDGAVTAIRFASGRVDGAVRIVDTPGLVAERAAGKALFPAYGTLPPGPARAFPRPKHAANINVLPWCDRLFALHEAGAPIELGPSLLTVGETDLDEPTLRQGFSAHPHAAPGRPGSLYNFGVHYGRTTELALYELREGRARLLATHALAGATMIHDFAVTARHLVFFAPPLRLDLRAFATGTVSYSDALAWQPTLGTEVLIIPIDAPASMTRFTVEPFYQWHFASAGESAEAIVVDFVRYPDFASNESITRIGGELVRATITGSAMRMEPLADIALEFPHATSDAVYAVGRGRMSPLGDRIVRVAGGSVVERELTASEVPSEPIHVPGPDGGWVLSLVYAPAEQASHVAVMTATELRPLARVWFDQPIPFTLHGAWRTSSLP